MQGSTISFQVKTILELTQQSFMSDEREVWSKNLEHLPGLKLLRLNGLIPTDKYILCLYRKFEYQEKN